MASRFQWTRLSDVIAETIGLHFPPERLTDLQRSLGGAAEEFGFDDIAECADWLLAAPLTKTQLEVLASHLTIGETYFFRDQKTLEVLVTRVLPELIDARRGGEQRLRLWSAACCSGEEAYSLAIVLHQVLRDLADWRVTILATDINARFLRKAVAGVYSEWSFRDAPAGFKERYFTRTADRRYAIRPEIAQLVQFESLNLVDDSYPSLATDTNAMDVIFCRNVLMYFEPEQTRKVIGKLHQTLVEGGWLAVSPSESSQALFPQFVTMNFPGAILYQKSDAAAPARKTMPLPTVWTAAAAPLPEPLPVRPHTTTPRVTTQTQPAPRVPAASLYEQGRYREAADSLLASFASDTPPRDGFSLLARALANQGRLADALAWCERWIAADKLNAAAHYVHAAVLLEHDRPDEARRSLQRALYLDPAFVLAYFALGNLARSLGNHGEADKHFANALRLLNHLRPDDTLPESDGLTAGRLAETIAAMTATAQTR
jgi:chemotaxis protein methyltransferase CheR